MEKLKIEKEKYQEAMKDNREKIEAIHKIYEEQQVLKAKYHAEGKYKGRTRAESGMEGGMKVVVDLT